MPASSSRSAQNVNFQLPPNSLKIAGIAFAIGVLLFLVVWFNVRRSNAVAPAATQPQAQAATELAPLPAPLPAGSGASEMPEARPAPVEEEEAPQLVETAPPPPPQPIAEAPQQAPMTDAGVPGAPVAAPVPTDRPQPIPGQSPPPSYPSSALRRGESGTVIVQAVVGVQGTVIDARVVQRSGSRDLDRAAVEAVRGWRFQPAQSNGQPMQASLDIPFDFKPAQ